VIIRDDSQSLEITVEERGPAGTPAASDLSLNVVVSAKGFTGRNDAAWVAGSDWNSFIEALRKLDRTRSGQAVISSMSPNDFQLSIFASGPAGHMFAQGWVGRGYYSVRSLLLENHVSFGIEIDPSTLPDLIQQLETLS
jgi:hypothetical protein